MESILNFIPAPIALVLMLIGFAALAVGAIRLGYKQYVKQWALELVTIAEDSIMGSGQGAKKKAQVFAALRGALPDWLKPFITDEVLDSVIEKAVSMMKKALSEKKPAIGKYGEYHGCTYVRHYRCCRKRYESSPQARKGVQFERRQQGVLQILSSRQSW